MDRESVAAVPGRPAYPMDEIDAGGGLTTARRGAPGGGGDLQEIGGEERERLVGEGH
jgi:hypothetical protein